MRILAIFIDALGSEYLNLCNEKAESTSMDELLKHMGGTLYTRCYTPAPDTARSSGCMWSGLYPKASHCDGRLKWPRDFLNKDVENIWQVFEKSGYRVNVFLDKNAEKLGLIYLSGREHLYTDSIYDFFEHAEVTNNSFNFFYLPDLHYVMDELDYTENGYKEGIDFTVFLLDEIFSFYNIEENFDYIMMFADHGFRLMKNGCSYYHVIDDDRVKTFMFIKKRGEKKLNIDDRLRSNMDIMPTICDMIDYKPVNVVDGISLFKKKGHSWILIEDFHTFSVNMGQVIEHWCVILSDGSRHWLECDGKWEHESSGFNEREFEKRIIEKMSHYDENRKIYATFSRYQKYIREHLITGTYSNRTYLGNTRYYYPNEQILLNKRVVLYGAGRVGNDFYKQFNEKHWCCIVLLVDLNWKERENRYQEICGIDRLFQTEFDYILISILDEKISKNVRNMLEQIGIKKNKILWSEPEKRISLERKKNAV